MTLQFGLFGAGVGKPGSWKSGYVHVAVHENEIFTDSWLRVKISLLIYVQEVADGECYGNPCEPELRGCWVDGFH